MEQYCPIELTLQNEINALSEHLNYETDLEELMAILYTRYLNAKKEQDDKEIENSVSEIIEFLRICSERYENKRFIEAQHMPFSYYFNKPKPLPSAILFNF